MMPERRIIARGGAVQPNHIYIQRQEESDFLALSGEPGCFTLSGCRTFGKTSLYEANRNTLITQGVLPVRIDMGGTKEAKTLTEWVSHFEDEVIVDLEGSIYNQYIQTDIIPTNIGKQWQACKSQCSYGSSSANLTMFFRFLTQTLRTHILITLDEIDVVTVFEFSSELIHLLSSLQATIVSQDLSLTLCFMGLRPFHELGHAHLGTASPRGREIALKGFSLTDNVIQSIAQTVLPRFGPQAEVIAKFVLEETGGHPFLTMILLDEISKKLTISILADVQKFIDHYLAKEKNNPSELFKLIDRFFEDKHIEPVQTLTFYKQFITNYDSVSRDPDHPSAKNLLLTALVKVSEDGLLIYQGPLFAKHFDSDWVDKRIKNAPKDLKYYDFLSIHKKPRICLFNTGGTIGMFRQIIRGEIKVIGAKDNADFLNRYPELKSVSDLEFFQPFTLDSINVLPNDWVTLSELIFEYREKYDSFVIAHGTDTMAFTASAVAFALGPNLSFPVIFTGAQTTSDVYHGDARVNLLRACRVAAERIPEVMVCFGNHVFRAVRAQKKEEYGFDGFHSPSYPVLAEITEQIHIYKQWVRQVPVNADGSVPGIELKNAFESGILMVQLTPGLEPNFYLPALSDPTIPCNGIIIQTLGAGNVTNLGDYDFNAFITKALSKFIPVLITSPFPWLPEPAQEFAPAATPLQAGAIAGGEMTSAAAVVKFRWALAQVNQRIRTGAITVDKRIAEVKKIMETPYVGEIDASKNISDREVNKQ